MEIDSEQFIIKLRAGDALSYETLVKETGGRMLAVSKRYPKIEADAQDCVQDAFLQAFRNIHTFKAQSSLAG